MELEKPKKTMSPEEIITNFEVVPFKRRILAIPQFINDIEPHIKKLELKLATDFNNDQIRAELVCLLSDSVWIMRETADRYKFNSNYRYYGLIKEEDRENYQTYINTALNYRAKEVELLLKEKQIKNEVNNNYEYGVISYAGIIADAELISGYSNNEKINQAVSFLNQMIANDSIVLDKYRLYEAIILRFNLKSGYNTFLYQEKKLDKDRLKKHSGLVEKDSKGEYISEKDRLLIKFPYTRRTERQLEGDAWLKIGEENKQGAPNIQEAIDALISFGNKNSGLKDEAYFDTLFQLYYTLSNRHFILKYNLHCNEALNDYKRKTGRHHLDPRYNKTW